MKAFLVSQGSIRPLRARCFHGFLVTLLSIAATSCGSGGNREDLAKQSEPVLGNIIFGSDCTTSMKNLLNASMFYGRVTSATNAFKECLSIASQTGMTNAVGSNYGPYQKCTGDPFFSSTLATQINEALAAARSWNNVSMACTGGNGNASTNIGTYAHSDAESLWWGSWLSDQTPIYALPVCNGSNGPTWVNCRLEPWPQNQAAGIIWHEAAHTHGYSHGANEQPEAKVACGYSSSPTWHYQVSTMPYIIEGCMGETLDRSAKRCTNFKSCGTGALGIITGFNSTTCTCAGDPQGNAELAGTAGGQVWHTLRQANGSWTPFGDVESNTGDIGTLTAVDLQHVGTDTHIAVVKSETGRVWHSIRSGATGAWTPFGEIPGAITSHTITRVGMGALGGDLHVLPISNQGILFHGIRYADGSWSQFGNASGQVGGFVAAHAAGLASDLHVCGVTSNGKVWHSIRSTATGNWLPFGDVKGAAGDVGSFNDVDCVAINNELHLAGSTAPTAAAPSGGIWHTVRLASGAWTSFGNVKMAAGDPGTIDRVAAFASMDTFQLTVRNAGLGYLLQHTIRAPNGAWSAFGDVEIVGTDFTDVGMN